MKHLPLLEFMARKALTFQALAKMLNCSPGWAHHLAMGGACSPEMAKTVKAVTNVDVPAKNCTRRYAGRDRLLCQMYQDGMSYEELAQWCGISKDGVRIAIARERRRASGS